MIVFCLLFCACVCRKQVLCPWKLTGSLFFLTARGLCLMDFIVIIVNNQNYTAAVLEALVKTVQPGGHLGKVSRAVISLCLVAGARVGGRSFRKGPSWSCRLCGLCGGKEPALPPGYKVGGSEVT